jgi:hypothetical protein
MTGLTGGTGDFNWDSNTLVVDSSESRVGIGTALPSTLLHLKDDTDSLVTLTIDNTGSGTTGRHLIKGISSGTAGGTKLIELQSDGNGTPVTQFVVDADGNVGIGEVSPDEMLHLTSGDNWKPAIKLEHTGNDGYGAYLEFHQTSIASEADADYLGVISWTGVDDNNVEERYAYIAGQTSDVTANDEAGKLSFNVNVDGAETELFAINGFNGSVVGQAEVIVNESGIDCDFRVESNDQTHMLYVNGGNNNIGIGQTSPEGLLHVGDNSGGDGFDTIAFFQGSSTQENNIFIGAERASNNSTLIGFKYVEDHSTSNYGYIMNWGDGPGDGIVIADGGKIGIGTNQPAKKLEVLVDEAHNYIAQFRNSGGTDNHHGVRICAGTGNATGVNYILTAADADCDMEGALRTSTGTFGLYDNSDRRLKDNIRNTEINGLTTVNSIKVRDFEWKKSGLTCVAGFVAQELKESFEPASPDDEDAEHMGEPAMMSVSRDRLVPVLVKAIQELADKVEALENA